MDRIFESLLGHARRLSPVGFGVLCLSFVSAGIGSPSEHTDGLPCKVTNHFGTGDNQGWDLAMQADGKIILSGFVVNASGDEDFAVARYNFHDCTPDTTFGASGLATADISGGGDDQAIGVAIQPDGKIVAVGKANFGAADLRFGVARFNPDGTLDTAGFGSGTGMVSTSVGSFDDDGRKVVIQPDGYIVVVGWADTVCCGADSDFAIVRYEPDGDLDLTFGGGDGIDTTAIANDDQAYAVTLLSDGSLLVAGDANGASSDIALVKYTSSGTEDTTWGGGDGIVTHDLGADEHPRGIAVQPDDKIVVSMGRNAGDFDFGAARFDAAGALDPSFNGVGWVTTDVMGTNQHELVEEMALQPDGKVIVVGFILNANWDFGIVRYDANGILDSTFGPGFNGIIVETFGANNEQAKPVLVQPDGDILVAGFAVNADDDFALVRYNIDGSRAVTHYRSIGSDAPYSAGDVGATNGSKIVSGSGTAWLANNWGAGDNILIDAVNYTVRWVSSDTELVLTSPFTGATGAAKPYTLSRKFGSLQAWEDCVDATTVPSPACDGVVTSSLITDERREVGVMYEGSSFAAVSVTGSATDAAHDITLTAFGVNRHNGIVGQGVMLDNGVAGVDAVIIRDDFVTVEWLEIKNGSGASVDGVNVQAQAPTNEIVLRNLLIHDIPQFGINTSEPNLIAEIYNNFIFTSLNGIRISQDCNVSLYNNTVYNSAAYGIRGINGPQPSVVLRNNIAFSSATADFDVPGLSNTSSKNYASDATACTHSPNGAGPCNGIDNQTLLNVNFVCGGLCGPPFDLHLNSGSTAEDQGADLSGSFTLDIDGALRAGAWDIGADQIGAATAVELARFEAAAGDGSAELRWETASEIDNLGFHLYRAETVDGPYARVTATLIPGLVSSPVGASYRYRDEGLTNGATYFYELEDVDSLGGRKRHGPVSTTPRSASSSGVPPDDASVMGITYGDPAANAIRVLKRGRRGVVIEVTTHGFHAEPQEDGSVRLEVPGFRAMSEPGSPAIPVKRAWIDALAGRKVRLVSVQPRDVQAITGLRPSDAALPEVVATLDGIVRSRHQRKKLRRAFREDGLSPSRGARIVNVGFQGQVKKALIELAPLRWDGSHGRLLLARRLVVHLSFEGREPAERTVDGIRGRRRPYRGNIRTVVAQLHTTEAGLYRVRFEDVMRGRRGIRASRLRLTRLGEPVAYHLHPREERFTRGSELFFVSEGARANPYGSEAVYELEIGAPGDVMQSVSAAPWGERQTTYRQRAEWEEERYYQSALLDAPDLWLWDSLMAPIRKRYTIEVAGLVPSKGASKLSVWLQGASDFSAAPDHHVRVYVNESFVGESRWDGKHAQELVFELAPGLLRDGENALELENVGDTDADYSMVMLDRYAIDYPRLAAADEGQLEGRWSESGIAELSGFSAGTYVLDVSDAAPRWITSSETGADGSMRFRAESGRSYLAVSPEAVRRPRVTRPRRSRLRDPRKRADYVIIAPAAFLAEAAPLVDLRRRQGLKVEAVSIENVYTEFGFGETTPDAIKAFLTYAYHEWRRPSLRYVVLLGDASFDFKDHLGTGVANRVPPRIVKTSYLWTASDPSYAAVNGDDGLPDLAIGRLPAASLDEARSLVGKIVAYETGGAEPAYAPVVLVADDPDEAGNFEADADALASSLLSPSSHRTVHKLYLSELGEAATRASILRAFDDGAFLVSYLGHGGIHLWASENIFNIHDAASLRPQSDQPLLVTVNCLNGYFHFPYFDALAERLLKAEGRGAIAAFSPSGLSLNGPADVLHRALLRELVSGEHDRLGDAVLAAQAGYAASGAMPELLDIYHLLGDPALQLRR